jgi:hypothetical protein
LVEGLTVAVEEPGIINTAGQKCDEAVVVTTADGI